MAEIETSAPLLPLSFSDSHDKEKPQKSRKNRLLCLDVLKGFIICPMTLVNTEFNLDPFERFEHVKWMGFSIADAIFPTFVFAMGVSIPLALRNGPHGQELFWKVVKRGLKLYALGMISTCIPYLMAVMNGWPWSVFDTYPYTGILHRLGVCYMTLCPIYAWLRYDLPELTPTARERNRFLLNYVVPVAMLGLWLLVTFGLYVPGCGRGIFTPECSAEGYIDTAIWGRKRNFMSGPFDTEGPLSHITASLTCYIGLRVGLSIVNRKQELESKNGRYKLCCEWLVCCILFMFAAYTFSPIIPIGKPIWTATFVCMAGAISLSALSLFMYAVDIKQGMSLHAPRIVRWCLDVWVRMGRNSLLLFYFWECMTGIVWGIPFGVTGDALCRVWFNSWFAWWLPAHWAGLAWGLMWLCCVIAPAGYYMDHKGWYIRV